MTLPPPVDLGAPLPWPTASTEMLVRLATRRSAPAQDLTAPGPDAAQIADILTLAARSPDHGKLFPWRFVVMGPVSRAEIAKTLGALAVDKGLPPKARAVLAKLTAAPTTVLVISTAAPGSKPVWEQELSAGAVCMNLEHAASAFGFASSWITDWYSYDADALPLFGVREGERVAGFIHLGTAAEPLLERDRPNVAALTTTLP
ncbi:nitroreductase [Brevundimonas sp.]|uniref:nitroreductase family protein n=1 Tax=Brevundimonas sp. TaxID=1871086 RepID=UPI00286D09E3|nr:nitroreductase [Brevundimonas sp.]